MIFTIPNSLGTSSSLKEFNPNHEPGGSPKGGRFASTKGGVASVGAPAILRGIDWERNAKGAIAFSQHFRQSMSAPRRPEEIALAEAALHALPLIHGTSVAGVVGAMHEGLKSHKDMAGERAALREEIDRLKEEIRDAWPEATHWTDNDWAEAANFDEESVRLADHRPEDVRGVATLFAELTDVEKVLNGTTYPAEWALGLDQFVFMTHGALHTDYGPVAVVIDNSVLGDAETWATPKDIMNVAHGNPGQEYDARVVRDYRSSAVRGDGYFKAAAERIGSVTGVVNRSRDQLWEVKAPHVPKAAVLGAIVYEDLDAAQRLANQPGMAGKVLYVGDRHGSESNRRLYRLLKGIQATKRWDKDLVRQLRGPDHSGFILL